MTANQQAARGCAPWPKDALRIGFGVIWLIDATLKWFDAWINLQHPAITFFWALVATSETLIALALIFGFARKVTYIAAVVFSVLIWSTAEGFGGPYTSGASDIGTGIIYAVVFAGLLALSYLEKNMSWWWRAAEVCRPGSAVATPAPEAVPDTV